MLDTILDFLVPILILILPVGAALIDKSSRTKKRAMNPQAAEEEVKAQVLTAEEIDRILGRTSAKSPAVGASEDSAAAEIYVPAREPDRAIEEDHAPAAEPVYTAKAAPVTTASVHAAPMTTPAGSDPTAKAIHRAPAAIPAATDRKTKDKIDKKKLIIYSEIMKPKF